MRLTLILGGGKAGRGNKLLCLIYSSNGEGERESSSK